MIASSVLPVAIAPAGSNGVWVSMFAAKAPAHTAGQPAAPNRTIAHSASPAGGQTGLTCSATNAARKPIFAATTYATANAAQSAICFGYERALCGVLSD